jgi:O-antigen biosynthesis protein
VVVDNGSDEKELHKYLRNEVEHGRITLLSYDKPFNHSAINNMAVAAVESEFVVLMNNDVVVKSPRWLEQMAGVMELDEKIAAVGCMLIYPLGLIQHAGVVLGLCGIAGHAHKNTVPQSLGYLGRLQTLGEFSAVTAAMMLLRRKSFLEVGGFDAGRYPALYNDVDLCLRLRKRGNRCIYDPMVKAIHHESLTRPISDNDIVSGRRLVEDYGPLLRRDPFYNPNLSLANERFFGFRDFPPEDQISALPREQAGPGD